MAGSFHADLSAALTVSQLRMTWFVQDGALRYTANDTVAYPYMLFNICPVALDTTRE